MPDSFDALERQKGNGYKTAFTDIHYYIYSILLSIITNSTIRHAYELYVLL